MLSRLLALDVWAGEQARVQRSLNDVHQRYINLRRWRQQNFALELCDEYSRINLNNIDLDAIAEEPNEDITMLSGGESADEYAKRKAAKYRAAARLSEFKLWLKNAAQKTGTLIIDPDEEDRRKGALRKPVSKTEDGMFCANHDVASIAKFIKAGI
jgi:hypothetical protein